MKKVFALLMVCGFAVAFVACGGGKTETAETADTTAVAADTTAADTTTAQ
jgi:hypothetical protein